MLAQFRMANILRQSLKQLLLKSPLIRSSALPGEVGVCQRIRAHSGDEPVAMGVITARLGAVEVPRVGSRAVAPWRGRSPEFLQVPGREGDLTAEISGAGSGAPCHGVLDCCGFVRWPRLDGPGPGWIALCACEYAGRRRQREPFAGCASGVWLGHVTTLLSRVDSVSDCNVSDCKWIVGMSSLGGRNPTPPKDSMMLDSRPRVELAAELLP